MNPHAITPAIDADTFLPGAQFIDAFRVATSDPVLDARHAAERMLGRQPRWVRALMTARNCIVAPFGLKTPTARTTHGDTVGLFPVVSESPERLVAGLNDNHLDFRVVVDVTDVGDIRNVMATTLVLTHNLLGRVYLAVILPFHRIIVRSMLRQVAG